MNIEEITALEKKLECVFEDDLNEGRTKEFMLYSIALQALQALRDSTIDLDVDYQYEVIEGLE